MASTCHVELLSRSLDQLYHSVVRNKKLTCDNQCLICYKMATTASHNSLSEGSLQRRICLLNGSCQGPVDKGPGSQGSDWLSGSGHILCHPCFSWGQGNMLPHSLSLCIYPQKMANIWTCRQTLNLCSVADTLGLSFVPCPTLWPSA